MSKIILLGTAFPYRGGLAAFNEMVAKKFMEQGHEVAIYTFTLQYPSFLFPGQTQYLSGADQKMRGSTVSHIFRVVNSVNPFNWFRVGWRLYRERPDVVMCKYWHPYFSPCFGVIARIARLNGHTRFVSQLDNVVAHESRWFDSFLTRFFVHSINGFVYMSEAVKRDLDLFTRSKPALFAPHPIFENFGARVPRAEAAAHLGLDPEVSYLLFFGIVRPYKGLDLLLDAWARLQATGFAKGRKLIVAGEYYSHKEQYLEQIERLGLAHEVLLHDWFIDDGDVKHYFSVADLLILPYREATQSGVTQIAYQFEVPLVVTRVGGLPEIVAEGRVGLVAEAEADSIAQTIEKALEPHLYGQLKENMRQERAHYSWERMCRTLLEAAR